MCGKVGSGGRGPQVNISPYKQGFGLSDHAIVPYIIYEKEMYRVLTFQFVEIQEVFTLNFQLIFLELNYQISPIW